METVKRQKINFSKLHPELAHSLIPPINVALEHTVIFSDSHLATGRGSVKRQLVQWHLGHFVKMILQLVNCQWVQNMSSFIAVPYLH